MDERVHPSFIPDRSPRISKNYRAKLPLYSNLNPRKFSRKNQNDFQINRFTTSILIMRQIIEGILAIYPEATLVFSDISWSIDSMHRGKEWQKLQGIWFP